MTMPKISVIIPTHNRAWSIRRAIESVLSQSFEDFELLIVDDGSTDQTQDILKTFKDFRIQVIKLKKGQGVSKARNEGIAQAQGEWLAFLDSDDEWLPHKLKAQWDYVSLRPKIKVVHGEEVWIRRGVRVNPKKKHTKPKGWIFQRCLPLCAISPSTVMIHRTVLQKVGAFDPEMIVCEDYDLWLRITPFYEVGLLEVPIIKKYGGHEDQLSARYKAMDYFRVRFYSQGFKAPVGPRRSQ